MMMRFLLTVLLCLAPAFSHAEEDRKESKPKAATETEAAAKDDAGKEAEAAPLPKVDWVPVESTGILSSAKDGAFEKTLWAGQTRTQIEEKLKELPDRQPLRSVLSLQRRLLLTRADASLIKNDVGVMRGNDLLIQRIVKLMDMGLYDDAWSLYTQKAEDPYDVPIAQLGMLLLLMKDNLATACLEEKVFATRYPSDKFFQKLDNACNQAMSDTPVAAGSFIAATNTDILMKMTRLERALALATGRIRYDGLTPSVLKQTPSTLLSSFLMDKALPDSAKAMIRAETDARGLNWYLAVVAQDENFKKARSVGKDLDAQWLILESVLATYSNPASLHAYASMFSAAKPTNLSTDTVMKVLGILLASGMPLPEFWLDEAQKRAPEKPLIYIYLQAFKSLTPTPDATVKDVDLFKSFAGLKDEDSAQIIAIIDSLDKKAELHNNPLRIYDKHSDLTPDGDYVMPNAELSEKPETDPVKKQIGITVMDVSIALAGKPDNMYSGTVGKSLNSLLNIGLIEDAQMIGSEIIAGVLNKY